MLQHKKFVKKTKKGGIVQVRKEHYLRDDIHSGTPLDPASDPAANKLAPDAKHYLVVDTNVALSQMDFLEHAAVDDVIVMGVVLEEVRHRNASAYQRLRALVDSPARRFFVFVNEHHRDTYIKAETSESPNDRNDRAIRVAASWYAARLGGRMPVLLLSNDADCRSRAEQEGLSALSVQAYARSRTDAPDLVDLVAGGGASTGNGADVDMADAAGGGQNKGAKRKRIFDDHRPMSAITAGIKQGTLHQGSLRVNRFNSSEGYVGSESVGQDILIAGRVAMNRALDGDIVAVELLPEEQWARAFCKP